MTTLNNNDKRILRGLAAAVAERGRDYRYPNGRIDGLCNRDPQNGPWYDDVYILHDFDKDWTNGFGSCYNLLPDGSGACGVGLALVLAGFETTRESSAGCDAERNDLSSAVRCFLENFQVYQDKGFTWGAALDKAILHLDDDQINEFFKEVTE